MRVLGPSTDIPDMELVARTLEGDREAFTGLVTRHGPVIYRVAYRVLGHRAAAEDVVQETFTRAFRGLGRYRGEHGDSSFRSWLCRIAVNQASSAARREMLSEGPVLPGTADGAQPAEEACLRRDVQEAMGRLPPHLRATLGLRVYGDLSYLEMAEALNCPVGTVMSRLAAARKAMRRYLADWLSDGTRE